jgi:general secretion pathway protein G
MNSIRTAFTLILPVVLFGIGASPANEGCRIRVVRANQGALKTAVDLYEVDTGVYPTETQGLGVLVTNPGLKTWRGPYIRTQDGELPTDPWGHQFGYRLTNGVPRIDSPGPDGVFGTADDNGKNWKPESRTTGCSAISNRADAV